MEIHRKLQMQGSTSVEVQDGCNFFRQNYNGVVGEGDWKIEGISGKVKRMQKSTELSVCREPPRNGPE